MIQAIGDISHLYPGYMAFANATRLRSIQVSSTEEGYSNSNATSLTFGANKMLETLICPNLPNVAAALDLSGCQSLKYIDARGSAFTGFAFADGGVLETALLPSPASISLRNLPYLSTFSLESYDNLTSVTVDTCPGVDSQALAESAANLVRVRLVGIDWTETSTEVTALLTRLYDLRGRDESDADTAQSVIAGDVYLTYARQKQLATYAEVWPDLTVSYGELVQQYVLSFYNADGTAILDKDTGEAYVQYVDRGSDGYDPVAAGEVDTPTMESTASTVYTYDGWNDNLTTVIADRTVTATYTEAARQYTVQWVAGTATLQTSTADYGSSVEYTGATPTDTSGESTYTYKLFDGWDKSTAYVASDMTVTAKWQSADLPTEGKGLEELSMVELYGIRQSGLASSYVEQKARFAFTMGYEPDFSNIDSVLLAENVELDGATSIDTGVAPLTEDASWTLVVDGMFDDNTADACLVSCFSTSGYNGFKVKYSSGFAVTWGVNSVNDGYTVSKETVSEVTAVTGQTRELAVLRHIKGEKNLTVYLSKPRADAIAVSELSKTILTTTDATVVIGSDNAGANYATGFVYRCKLWYGDLGDAECRKMAAWPREECYLEATGCGGISQSNGQKSNIDFIFGGLLGVTHQMNTSNDNTGGWPATTMRTWLHNRVLDSLPEALRNMVLEVVTTSVDYADGAGDIVQSNDQLYLPSHREMGGGSRDKEPYVYCGDWIPWFTSDNLRKKFLGYTIPTSATYTSATTPPS